MNRDWQRATHVIRVMWIFVVFLWLGAISPVHAQNSPSSWPPECTEGTLGTPGQGDYQLTLICLPSQNRWNGNLFVYAHGFVNPQDPIALPSGELGSVSLNGQSLIQFVLARGYGFATSSYSRNGWAIEAAGENLDALVEKAKSAAPSPPKNVLMIGGSEGGLVTVMQLEKHPDIYAGGLSLCGVVGGSLLQVKYIGDFRAVFDSLFPGVFDFGVVTVPPDAPLKWQSQYSPAITGALQNNPDGVDSLFSVTGAAQDSSNLTESRNKTAQVALGYNIFETNDVIQVSGGNPYDNTSTHYSGSPDDQALNAKVERVAANPAAVEYLTRFYEPTGDLQRPLVAMHNLQDPNVPFQHEIAYGEKVRSKDRLSNLTSIPVPGYGHCAFQSSEVLAALVVLLARTQAVPSFMERPT